MAGAGIYRATVTAVGSSTLSLQIPNLTFAYVYTDVPFYVIMPSVNDEIIVGFLNGEAGNPVAIIPGGASAPSSSAQGDIIGVTAGLGLSGGGTSGTVSLAFDPSELSSVTVAIDDKVVIADTSDSDNPKHVTAQSIADLAPQGDITGVTAGLGIGGGGTTGTVEVTFDPSELSSVTVATDDKVVIADTSDSDNPKHVTAQSIADLASVSPAGSDTQVQFNNSGSFGASSNMVFDGTNLTVNAGGADGGIVLGEAFSSSYVGVRTAGMTGSEYMMISLGSSTYVSCGAGGDLYLRGAENNSTTQIQIDAGSDLINIGTSDTKTKFAGFIEVLNEIQAGSGSVSDPSYTFDSDEDTGIYHTTNVLRFTTGGSQRGLFSSSGLYAIKASGYGTTAVWSNSTGYLLAYASSIRFKENVVDMPQSEWEKIYQLAPRSFDWKTDGTVEIPVAGAADFGFIAEEVNEILPEVVTWSRESHAEDDDDLGLGNESDLQIQAIAYEKLTTYLVAAVKDLKARIEALES